MTTPSQVEANQTNAQRSTGPRTPEGRSISALNNFRHGLAGTFRILDWESQQEFDELFASLRQEHAPTTPTETVLVESLAQHFWFAQRAMRLQERCLHTGFQDPGDEKRFLLYLRYQTTHERAFHHSLNQLLKLRAEKRKQQIGFESQQRKEADELRKQAAEAPRQAAEIRQQQMHEARLRAVNAQTAEREIDTEIRQTIEAPLPGRVRIPFDALKSTFQLAVNEVNRQMAADHSPAIVTPGA